MLKINDKVKFHYLKQFKDELKSGQVLTDYTTTSEEYSGKVVDVRNIIDQPVSHETIRRITSKGDGLRCCTLSSWMVTKVLRPFTTVGWLARKCCLRPKGESGK